MCAGSTHTPGKIDWSYFKRESYLRALLAGLDAELGAAAVEPLVVALAGRPDADRHLTLVCLLTLFTHDVRPLTHWVPEPEYELFFRAARSTVVDYVCRGALTAEQARAALGRVHLQCLPAARDVPPAGPPREPRAPPGRGRAQALVRAPAAGSTLGPGAAES